MKFNIMIICLILAFGLAGASYASWEDEFFVQGNLRTGQIDLVNDEDLDNIIDLNELSGHHTVDFTILNNSTMPIRATDISFMMNGETTDSLGTVEFHEVADDTIEGQLELDLKYLEKYIVDHVFVDEEEGDFSQTITVLIAFSQANTERGWSKEVGFDIEVFKISEDDEVDELLEDELLEDKILEE